MNDIQKAIQEAHRLVSIIPVSGDAVDVMSAARINLKEAYRLAGDKSALWEAHKLEREKLEKLEKLEKEKADG